MKHLAHHKESVLSPWSCPRIRCDFKLVFTQNSEMKVEWTLLTAPIHKSRCRARTLEHAHPRSAPVGTRQERTLRRSRKRWFGSAAVTCYRWLELRCNQPAVPWSYVHVTRFVWRRARATGRGTQSQLADGVELVITFVIDSYFTQSNSSEVSHEIGSRWRTTSQQRPEDIDVFKLSYPPRCRLTPINLEGGPSQMAFNSQRQKSEISSNSPNIIVNVKISDHAS
jgi:hypothetical protein